MRCELPRPIQEVVISRRVPLQPPGFKGVIYATCLILLRKHKGMGSTMAPIKKISPVQADREIRILEVVFKGKIGI